MDDALDMRYVEVRSWPERADIVVVDRASGEALAHYDLTDVPAGRESSPLFDVRCPWSERAQAALQSLEQSDQDLLRAHFGVDDEAPLQLAPDPEPRGRLEQVLAEHGLSLDEVEFRNLPRLVDRLERMDLVELWALVSDWYDVSARRYPAGISRQESDSWVHRAHPDRREHFGHITRGDADTARELFREQVDLSLDQFTLYELLCWVYFSRTEFADHDPFPLGALTALAA